ncbi:MAG: NADH-quinone oxidoreductase subunit L [Elusimicrobiota bacterium]
MIETNIIRWIVIFPLISFLINFLFSKFIKEKISSFIASLGVGLSFLVSFFIFLKVYKLPDGYYFYDNLFEWISIPTLNIPVVFLIDRLSMIMALIVTGVSFLIHIYSISYMNGDKDFKRFFSYLNLFVFFMLILVLAENIILMFVGWEGVGLCSYLLIGFWYENINNSKAAKKAFITNRIGDAFFIAGVIIINFIFSSNNIYDLSFKTINSNINILQNTNIFGFSAISLIAFLLFMGATGKSAQFPLYVWLPDAMAGPTPVSALIHAATMVTAGVYLLARLNPLFQSTSISNIIIYIACFTAILSALIAMAQRDIKKILAYSTISQLGYMFMGVLTNIYASGIFHLVTHAFFKALLFLTAGAVIHSLGGEQDIFKMGNILKNKLKSIFLVMIVGWLSITGFPFLSGYYSKDLIIEGIYLSGHRIIWIFAIFGAFLTAFYMTRLLNIAFIRKTEINHHIHYPDSIMTIPLLILAFLSIIAGYFMNSFLSFLSFKHIDLDIPLFIEIAPLLASILGMISGFYFTQDNIANKFKEKFIFIHNLVVNKFYIDELYEFLIINPIKNFSAFIFKFIDRLIIDELIVEGVGRFFYRTGEMTSRIENSNIRSYASYILFGVLIMIYIYMRSF